MQALTLLFRFAFLTTVPICVLIALILLVKKAFDHRVSASFHYVIWFLLIIRLLVPFSPQSPTSALNLISSLTELVQNERTPQTDPIKNLPKPAAAKRTVNASLSPWKPEPTEGSTDAVPTATPFENFLALTWMTGMLLSLSYAILLNWRFRAKMKNAVPTEDTQTLELANQCRSILHLSADIPVSYTNLVGTPSLYGVFHPWLLLPQRLEGMLSSRELKYVLLHELAHFKRRDIPVIWVTAVIKSFYWFNPLVWYAFYRMRLDGENACDELVLSRLSTEERNGYGHLLLHLLEMNPPQQRIKQAAIISKVNKIQWKRRITMIANYKPTTPKRVILAAALVAVIGITGMTGAQQISAQAVAASPITVVQQSTVMPTTAKDAAAYWAETLEYRDWSARYAILSDNLKKAEWKSYNENRFIGYSSPWVISYVVNDKGQTDFGTKFEINYTFTDSSRNEYTGSDFIIVKQFGQNWFVVQHQNLEAGFPDLSDSKGQLSEVQFAPAPKVLPSKTAEGTLELWAEGLQKHSAAYRLASLAPDLKEAALKAPDLNLFLNLNGKAGISGLQVINYTVNLVSQAPNTEIYHIDYQLADSKGKTHPYSESVTLQKQGNGQSTWWITKY